MAKAEVKGETKGHRLSSSQKGASHSSVTAMSSGKRYELLNYHGSDPAVAVKHDRDAAW